MAEGYSGLSSRPAPKRKQQDLLQSLGSQADLSRFGARSAGHTRALASRKPLHVEDSPHRATLGLACTCPVWGNSLRQWRAEPKAGWLGREERGLRHCSDFRVLWMAAPPPMCCWSPKQLPRWWGAPQSIPKGADKPHAWPGNPPGGSLNLLQL